MKKFTGILVLLFTLANIFAQGLPENLSGIRPAKTTGPNADKLFNDIDNTYNQIYKYWQNSQQYNINSNSMVGTISQKDKILSQVAQIRQNTQNSIDALEPFKPIPVIGTATNASALALKATASQMDKVKDKIESLNKIALQPVAERSVNLNKTVAGTEKELLNLLVQLRELKKGSVEQCNKVASGGDTKAVSDYESGASNVSKYLAENSNDINSITQSGNKLNTLNNVIQKAKPVFDKTVKGLDDFMDKFKNSRKVVNEVNEVLDKRFKKKVLGKQISISVRDVITGGGALKKAKKLLKKIGVDIEKWAKKALAPVTKKLGEKLPALPNLDNYYAKVDELKSKVDEFQKVNDSFTGYNSVIKTYSQNLKNTAQTHILK